MHWIGFIWKAYAVALLQLRLVYPDIPLALSLATALLLPVGTTLRV